MLVGERQRRLVVAERHVGVADAPVGAPLAHLVVQLARDLQVRVVELHGARVLAQQRVRVAEAVACLRFERALAQRARDLQRAPVDMPLNSL